MVSFPENQAPLVADLASPAGFGTPSSTTQFVATPPPPPLQHLDDGRFTVVGRGFVLNASRLVSGAYEVVAYWPDLNGVKVGTVSLAVNVASSMVLVLRDVSVKVVGVYGRSLEGAVVSVNPNLLREGDHQTSPDGTTIPFKDKRVHQALNYAVNKESIFKNVMFGVVDAFDAPLHKSLFGNCSIGQYPYNPAKARELLQ